jgi:hypothetical protein
MDDRTFIKWYCGTPVSQIEGYNQQALTAELAQRRLMARTPEAVEAWAEAEKSDAAYAALQTDLKKLQESDVGSGAERLVEMLYANMRANRDQNGTLVLKACQLDWERFPKYIEELKAKLEVEES